jgi:hypothetical protein
LAKQAAAKIMKGVVGTRRMSVGVS